MSLNTATRSTFLQGILNVPNPSERCAGHPIRSWLAFPVVTVPSRTPRPGRAILLSVKKTVINVPSVFGIRHGTTLLRFFDRFDNPVGTSRIVDRASQKETTRSKRQKNIKLLMSKTVTNVKAVNVKLLIMLL